MISVDRRESIAFKHSFSMFSDKQHTANKLQTSLLLLLKNNTDITKISIRISPKYQ